MLQKVLKRFALLELALKMEMTPNLAEKQLITWEKEIQKDKERFFDLSHQNQAYYKSYVELKEVLNSLL